MMYKDEIISEAWRNRDAYVRQHGSDLARIVEDLRRRQDIDPDRVVDHRASKASKKS